MKRREKHLYRNGAEPAELREFEKRYGRKKGRKVYGATVAKVQQERLEEEDLPRSSPGGSHNVDGHYADGTWVRQHRAKNPRR